MADRRTSGFVLTGIALAAVIGAAAGCDDTNFNSGGHSVDGEGYEAVLDVFEAGTCLGCHSAAAALGGLDLETDPCGDLVGVTAANYDAPLVIAGDSANSVLWAKVADNGAYGGVMPQSGTMDQANIDIIASWIDDGASCEGGGGGDDGGSDTWEGEFSYANVQAEVFDAKCVFCHTEGGSGEVLLLDSFAYDDIVDVASTTEGVELDFIEPGDPAASYLYLKVIGDESIVGDPMPADPGLTDLALVDLLNGWITAGAPE